jgi:hypothetical protein
MACRADEWRAAREFEEEDQARGGRLLVLGADLLKVSQAPTTSIRDSKEFLRTLLEEVIITVHKNEGRTHVTLRWRGGLLADVDPDTPRYLLTGVRTDEDTIALVPWLIAHHPDSVIAGILNVKAARALTVIALRPTSSAVCADNGTSLVSNAVRWRLRGAPTPEHHCSGSRPGYRARALGPGGWKWSVINGWVPFVSYWNGWINFTGWPLDFRSRFGLHLVSADVYISTLRDAPLLIEVSVTVTGAG